MESWSEGPAGELVIQQTLLVQKLTHKVRVTALAPLSPPPTAGVWGTRSTRSCCSGSLHVSTDCISYDLAQWCCKQQVRRNVTCIHSRWLCGRFKRGEASPAVPPLTAYSSSGVGDLWKGSSCLKVSFTFLLTAKIIQ